MIQKQKRKQLTLQKPEWYRKLIADCKMIILQAKIDLIRRKWELGQRIFQDQEYLNKEYGDHFIEELAKDIGISERTLYYSMQFRNKFSKEQLENEIVTRGSLSWKKIKEEWLPEFKKTIFITPLPEGKFDVILADPPWEYELQTTTEERKIDIHYPTMPMEIIKNLPIQDKIFDDAVLFLWVPKEFIDRGLEVLKAWGFQYKSQFVWDKIIIGMGYWVRSQHEVLLIGSRGNFPVPLPERRYPSIFKEPREEIHSKKPEKVYQIIEGMFPNHKYLELFARNKRENWQSWGNEL